MQSFKCDHLKWIVFRTRRQWKLIRISVTGDHPVDGQEVDSVGLCHLEMIQSGFYHGMEKGIEMIKWKHSESILFHKKKKSKEIFFFWKRNKLSPFQAQQAWTQHELTFLSGKMGVDQRYFAPHSSPVDCIGKISHWQPKTLIYFGNQPLGDRFSDICLVRILTFHSTNLYLNIIYAIWSTESLTVFCRFKGDITECCFTW